MKIIIIFFSFIFLFGGIKEEIKSTKLSISKMNERLDALVKEIVKNKKDIKKIDEKIQKVNNQIAQLEANLTNSNKTLGELKDLKKGYIQKQTAINKQIEIFLSTNYYLDTKDIENLNDLVQSEIKEAILKKYSSKIDNLMKENIKIQKNINNVTSKINQILKKKEELAKKKQELVRLLKNKKAEVAKLNKKRSEYKKRLYALIKRQKSLQKKLESLKVIKVKKYSVNYKVKEARYKGRKTIAPVAGRVVKKFGSYIDPVYKIRIYNDSITIKPYEENAKVRAIMAGKVLYIGESNGKKIIVLKHKNKIFSIYANLDKISPLLKQGSYVRRGQIIARVKDSLEFEVTYKDRPINPLKVVKF